MNKMHQFTIALAAAALAACSSMDLSDAEALSENFPRDFNTAEYVSLHPNLHSVEIINYVSDYNNKLKDSLGDAYTELMTNDNIAFIGDTAAGVMGDTATIHKILVDTRLGGYSEQQWNDIWLSTVKTKSDTVWDKRMVSCQLKPLSTDSGVVAKSVTVVIDSVVRDSAGKLLTIVGKVDTTGESQVFDLTDSSYTFIQQSGKYDSTVVSVNTTETEVKGYFSNKQASYVKSFNMVGVPKETLYEVLLAVPMDEFAISYQYTVFGRSHGWAYRRCTEEEKQHPIQTEVYPMQKYYCDDNGIAKEI